MPLIKYVLGQKFPARELFDTANVQHFFELAKKTAEKIRISTIWWKFIIKKPLFLWSGFVNKYL